MSQELSLIVARVLGSIFLLLFIFILVKLRKLFKSLLYSKAVVVLPLTQNSVSFEVFQKRNYGLWLQGKWLKRTPLSDIKPVIREVNSNHNVSLYPAFWSAQTNNFKKAYIQLSWFTIGPGIYELNIEKGSSLSYVENSITKHLFSSKKDKLDIRNFSLEIREDPHPKNYILLFFLIFALIFVGLLGFQLLLFPQMILSYFFN